MSMPVLATKLYIPPPRPNLVPRPRLVQRLNADLWQPGAFLRRLTLISAPPGYGKTTLAAGWLRESGFRFTWLSLDPNDNDPAHILAYLTAACQQIDPQIGKSLPGMLRAPQPPPPESLLTALVNEIAAASTPFILALDDYHHIHSSAVHQVINFLLEYQPANMHTAIITREDPPVPIVRLRARHQLVEVRQADLCFTPDEAGYFFHHSMGLALHPDEVQVLAQRTEGWAAGLHLAALSMQSSPNRRAFIQSFTGSSRYILDYLFEEVLTKQTAGVQDFLLKTSILSRLSAPLCDAITGRRDSATLLHDLDHANLFIECLDQACEWYRYHPLFKELLRHRLKLAAGGGGMEEISEAELHSSAGRWLGQNGYPEDAVDHALLAGDWGYAVALVSRMVEAKLMRGEFATLIAWFKRMPEGMVRSNPRLCLAYAWPLMLAGQLDLVESWLAHAESLVEPGTAILGEISAAQAYLTQVRGEDPRLVEYSERALALLPESNLTGRGLVALNLGLAHWHRGRLEEAEKALEIALHAAQATGNAYAAAASQIFRTRCRVVRGRLHRARIEYREILETAVHGSILSVAHLDLGALFYEWNDLPNAAEHIRQGLEIAQRSGNEEFIIAGFILLARLRLAQGDPDGALEAANQARRVVSSGRAPLRIGSRLDAFQAELALALGDLEEASRQARDLPGDAEAHPFYRFLGLTKPRLWIALGRKVEAAPVLQECFTRAIQSGWGYGAIAARLLQALSAGPPSTALELLADALSRAQPEGYIRTFADVGEQLAPLLVEAARLGMAPDYAGQILSAIHSGAPAAGGRSAQNLPGKPALVEPLSDREIEVLRLVVAGLTNREIAVKLYISPGTAKTHIHHIFGKLGARNRTEVTMRARELGLV